MVYHLNNSFDVINMLKEIEVLDHLRVAHHNLLRSLWATEGVRRTAEPPHTEPAYDHQEKTGGDERWNRSERHPKEEAPPPHRNPIRPPTHHNRFSEGIGSLRGKFR